MEKFKLKTDFKPAGSQPVAIKKLIKGIKKGFKNQVLLGVTGSGKTFSVANVIEAIGKPTLVLAHNKTLAAQLYNELKDLFPNNRVEYFVSYYDYYQPESYIAARDQYIEKDAQINPRIEQMRLSTTASLMSRKDTIVVASVSCIYNIGNPTNYDNLSFEIKKGDKIKRNELIEKLVDIQYERNDIELTAGRFKVKGDTIDIIQGYGANVIRVEMFGDEIDKIIELEKTSLAIIEEYNYMHIFPARHFVVPEKTIKGALAKIEKDLKKEIPGLDALEAHRLKTRTKHDIEMIGETGFCKGMENYSRYFDGRKVGEKPYSLLDYFPAGEFMLVIDESHQSIPQVHGMYKGDRARKQNLVDYGFRLKSALDNRPLKYNEFEKYIDANTTLFVSATPGDYEKNRSKQIVEQIIRPTGLLDPEVFIRPIKGQIEDLKMEISKTIKRKNRVLVTTLTKKLAEELTEFLAEAKIKTRYLHSEIETLERSEIIRELRLGKFDVLVGINLLREGLDIPEVGFIGILDADKEGFLRDTKSLIQIIGRAARNSESKVVMYADKQTDSIKKAVKETARRRKLQIEFNAKNKITPKTIVKPIKEKVVDIKDTKHIAKKDIPNLIIEMEADMNDAADTLDFETAIVLRNKIKKLKERVD
ncbi:excinuclease ABC subunit UvrB [Candidatus Woesearchaeota archaeon]|jgi:excinuclease ABC subunit B|nr:excinuclease ABC subunit UvrB [Candidatus Woesearchaeota archaeon]MBT6040960.1 excinuclease ABC subunit UvrB [Candidatus Woesearchaeota archaeon]MBT6336150.1 excinuclease ABC subunit UvrB [Candidatus Woesearchaeota archaeon]MBT7928095.1 excinuclease ABC subunit UvrB [Candidatus Woesearchaeota archaeon]